MNMFFSGSSCLKWAENLAQLNKTGLSKQLVSKFADGETRIEVEGDVENKNIFVCQSTYPPVNEHYMELFILLDALKRQKAKNITVIMPYFGYSRQDRPVAPGSPISAQLSVQLCQQAGAVKIITLDLHSKRTLDFFGSFIENIELQVDLAEQWKKSMPCQSVVCVSPDAGGLERAQNFAQVLNSPTAFIEKKRSEPNKAEALHLKGDVQGKNIIIIDDIIDTAGTLCTAVDSLIKNGAKDVFVVATHGLFSEPALERIKKSPVKQIWVTDSVKPKKEILDCKKIKIVPTAHLFYKAIQSDLRNN